MTLGRFLIGLSCVLLSLAIARDTLDRWIAATVLPPLFTETSVEVLDRNGDLLRAYTVADGRWRMAVTQDAVDPDYLSMLVRYEDKRFFDHSGVDVVAALRATGHAILHRQIVSGGSTLTMQVARLIEGTGTGSWAGKLRQIRVALALERVLSKEQILGIYLERAPFGGNIEGIRAASLAYFGKPPRRLTTAEAALLVAIPQSPETRRPDRHPDQARLARNRVLERMEQSGTLSGAIVAAAATEPVPDQRSAFPVMAAHLADRLRTNDPTAQVFRLTIDARLQQRLEHLAAEAVRTRSDGLQIAIMVLDHQTGEVLSSVGSSGYSTNAPSAYVDLTRAVRSPGSTLKPLIYALGFENGLIHPETMIDDRPSDFAGYRPSNFDGAFRGQVRVRSALQQSLNVPAVAVLDAIGPAHLVAAMHRAGAAPVVPGNGPGLAIALGGLGTTLEDLVRIYASIANHGIAVDLRYGSDLSSRPMARVMGDVAAWEIADILLEVPRPYGIKGAGIAFKTGTSYGFRDAWAVGFDGRHVVGVWMGRADGTPVPGALGGDIAAPVMFAAFERVKPQVDPIGPPPPATLLLPTAQLPLPLRSFRSRGLLDRQDGPQIAFPPDGAMVEDGFLTARVTEGQPPFTWLANGAPVQTTNGREVDMILGAGFTTLTVIDATGQSDRSHIQHR